MVGYIVVVLYLSCLASLTKAQTNQTLAIDKLFQDSNSSTVITNCINQTTDSALCASCSFITCDGSNRVTVVTNIFSQTIPTEIGLLTTLSYIFWDPTSGLDYPVSGTIPTELFIPSLTFVSLKYFSFLEGTLPTEIGLLQAATQFILSNSGVSGPIPSEIWGLTKLTSLNLAYNHFSGPIQPFSNPSPSFASLVLDYNFELNGTIPKPPNSTIYAQYQYNQFDTIQPDYFDGLFQLGVCFLNQNRLSGTFPTGVGQLVGTIAQLALDHNQFSGPISPGLLVIIGNGTQLSTTSVYDVDLSNNLFTGLLPTEAINPTIESIDFSNNQFSDVFPTQIIGLSGLVFLRLNHNQLYSTIPDNALTGLNLGTIDLSGNLFSGTFPTFGDAVTRLIINNNQFSGPFLLPGTCVSLKELSIEDCNFTSINFQTDIATYFNSLPSNGNPEYALKSVDASRNALTEFPSQFFGNLSYIENNPAFARDDVIFPNVKVLLFSRNQITGTIPTDVYLPMSANVVDFGSNQISGSNNVLLFRSILKNNQVRDACQIFEDGFPSLQWIGQPNLRTFKPQDYIGVIPNGEFLHPTFRYTDLSLNRIDTLAIGSSDLIERNLLLLPFSTSYSEDIPQSLFPQDIDECNNPLANHTCSDFCADGWLPLLDYTCGCRLNDTEGTRYLTANRRNCSYCAGVFELSPQANFDLTALFDKFGVDNVTQASMPWATCSRCSSGTRFLLRTVAPETACAGVPFSQASVCSYPCLNQNLIRTAANAIQTLAQEFAKENFLADAIYKLFGANVTFQMSKRQSGTAMTYTIVGCDPNNASSYTLYNSTGIYNFISQASQAIVPNAPQIAMSTGACAATTTSTDTDSSAAIGIGIGVSLGVAFLLLLLILVIVLVYFLYFRKTSILNSLPDGVVWSYRQKENKEGKWGFQGSEINGEKNGFYYKDTDPNTNDWTRIMQEFNNYCGGGKLQISKIRQIYNPGLIQSFAAHWQIVGERISQHGGDFATERWRKDEPNLEHREHVKAAYERQCQKFEWNRDLPHNPILMVSHGTDSTIADKIAQTGFANLSSLDAGFYGRGIYFSSDAMYCFPYFGKMRFPAVILSWVIPGHIYPVVENHQSSHNSLLGKALLPGYMSHYVLTTREGFIAPLKAEKYFDELVIPQESQICPCFILEIGPDNFNVLHEEWNRAIANERTVQFARDAEIVVDI